MGVGPGTRHLMRVNVAPWELQNIVRERGGGLRTRRGLVSVKTPTAGTVFVDGRTIESAFTSEPWHYLTEQSTTTSVATLRVFTEEFFELFSLNLGPLPLSPIITHGVQSNQIVINSPSLSGAAYGLVGGGLMTIAKASSENPDTTALDVPTGHVCAFGDRLPIAAGNLVYFNDPGVDLRTYVSQNAVGFPGSIYDIVQGPGGGLYVFTSNGVYVMAGDALGQGQEVAGFISRVPGLETTRPRNAAASGGQVAVLQKDGIQLVDGEHIPITRSKHRRYWSKVVDVEDLRSSGELFATPRGFLVGFSRARGYFLDVDLETRSFSWVTSTTSAFNVAGTLRSREGELLVVLRDRVVVPHGNVDYDGAAIRGTALGSVDIGEDIRPVTRRVTLSADNYSQTVGTAVNGDTDTSTTPTKSSDFVLGTALWSASTAYAGRHVRTTRLSHAARAQDPHIELRVDGGNRRIEPTIDVEFAGQGKGRRDRNG